MSITDTALLSTDEAIGYWDRRHRTQSELRSGGDIGLAEADNEAFYARRLGALLEIVEEYLPTVEPVLALDAGCGKGYFADCLERCGFLVDGIDSSDAAIDYCRARCRGRFSVARLDELESPWQYDLVCSIDVLFHILDDEQWEASFRNLASLVKPGGLLTMTDLYEPEREVRDDYIIHRSRDEYGMLAPACGLTFLRFRPYGFRRNRVGFYIFTKDP